MKNNLRIQKPVPFLTVIAIGILLIWPALTQAADFTVNSTADTVDISVTDSGVADEICADASNQCTLRAAIQETNALAGSDTITLPAGTYTLTIAGANEDAAATGDLDITGRLTINGAGESTTIVDGNLIDRVFDIDPVNSSGITVSFTQLKIQNGKSTSDHGGGIKNNKGNLSLTNVSVTNNQTTTSDGGGIATSMGTVILTNGIVSNNSAAGQGGGIYGWGASSGIRISIINSTISGNQSTGNGGGISTGQELILKDSTVRNNTSDSFGGGIFINGSATLKNTTISANTANLDGGGIQANNGSLQINNSTISGNRANNDGGGLSTYIDTIIASTTITQNRADNDNDGNGDGGGVAKLGTIMHGTVTIKNTLIAGNTGLNGTPDDCSGPLSSEGYNLIQETSGCTITDDTSGNITGQDPLLDALADNGGDTRTHALQLGSPAIDAGNPVFGCKDANGNVLTKDQRGFPRVDGDNDGNSQCDIGAFEVQFTCGDETVQTGEECDDGAGNSDTNPDACRTSCRNPSCGDEIIDTGEECDDDGESEACDSDCTAVSCGDGTLNTTAGEECDNGAGNSDTTPNACRTDCTNPRCGDGITDAGEGCDDANADNTDPCLDTCVSADCGDGVIQKDVEKCDDGLDNSDIDPDACRTSCIEAYCGDGVTDAGEACDDGNADNTDACLNTCVVAECGDGFVQAGVEKCDNGNSNSDTTANACRTNCAAALCGDGVVDTGEECDDGNTEDGDNCSADCKTEKISGNGDKTETDPESGGDKESGLGDPSEDIPDESGDEESGKEAGGCSLIQSMSADQNISLFILMFLMVIVPLGGIRLIQKRIS